MNALNIANYVSIHNSVAAPLTNKQKRYLEKCLLEWKNSLVKKMLAIADAIKNQHSEIGDTIDVAKNAEELSYLLVENYRIKDLIEEIHLALEHLEANKFGACETCELPISFKRLEAHPIAKQCVECKKVEEIAQSQLSTFKHKLYI